MTVQIRRCPRFYSVEVWQSIDRNLRICDSCKEEWLEPRNEKNIISG